MPKKKKKQYIYIRCFTNVHLCCPLCACMKIKLYFMFLETLACDNFTLPGCIVFLNMFDIYILLLFLLHGDSWNIKYGVCPPILVFMLYLFKNCGRV